MALERIQTSLRFEEELLVKITYIAKKERRSVNAQLEYLAGKCIKEYEEMNGEIQLSDEEKYAYRK